MNRFKNPRYLCLLVFLTMLLVGRPVHSETDKADLHQALLDLTSPWTVMCVAAHPDDEDGSTLTILRRKYGMHTVSLFSTFGEGGQNAVGPELYEELGVIRARETMAAAEVQGSEPHFLGFKDFGFSKSAEETYAIWGGEKEVLRRMVLQIRLLRPDVIITNHDTTSGHGNHQSTGRTVLAAVDAAADPKQFPEQLATAGVWQVQRLFVRNFRGEPAAGAQVVTLDPNETDPIRGTTYAQQALEGLHKHATQGPWPRTVPAGGARQIRYSLVKQAPNSPALPANAKTPVDGLVLPEAVAAKLVAPTIDNKPLSELVDRRLEVLVWLLNAKRRGVFTAPKEVVETDPHRFSLMWSRLDAAIATATGASVSLNPEDAVLVPGYESQLAAVVTNGGVTEIQIKRLKFSGLGVNKTLEAAEKMLPGTDTSAEVKVSIPKTMSLTVPSSEHLYDGRLFGEPLKAEAELSVEGVTFHVETDTRRDVAPAVEIVDVDPSPYVTTPATSQKPLEFNIKLKNHLPTEFRGLLRVRGQSLETGREIDLHPGETETSNLVVRTALPTPQIQGSSVAIIVDQSIPKDPIAKRDVPLVYADAIVVNGRRVGYLPSYDQTLERALAALGVDAKKLTVDEIAKSDLSSYNTIIIDNRGYEAHHDLIPVNDRLLKFAEDGGTLLVFYHRTGEWNPDPSKGRPQLAPYPIIVGDERVTEEVAPVLFLQPRHPLLNFPNRITQKDFANWVQERGLYFPKEWDQQHYTAVLSTQDKGEQPLKGGLLVGAYGRGNYIYTSYVWYRQLRAGLPGGYRFFANLISYGRRKED